MSTCDTKLSDSLEENGFSVSVNPATGEEIERFPLHNSAQQDEILASAYRAQLDWAKNSIDVRGRALSSLAKSLRAHTTALASRITAEMGKPITAARAEVAKCAALCDWYATHSVKLLADEQLDLGADGHTRVAYLPIGVVLGVMPWNFPLWQVLRAAVPILAAGNAFILKHADNVQGCAAALAEALRQAGVADGIFGVLNVSRRALPRIISDRRVAAVTVTAGVAAGSVIAAEAGRNLKKSLLELGGSDPFIVLADADVGRAVSAAIEARFRNAGQVCIAAKRLIVERSIAEQFTERFVAAASCLRQGDPRLEETELGPMARHRLREELHAQVSESRKRGAQLVLGGEMPNGPGAYYPATVLTNITSDMPVFREETFGPVAPIILAEDSDDAVRLANDSDFGLAGAVWSKNIHRAVELADRIESGGIFINGIAESDPRVPIGGIKKSGYGRELSHFGLREFCNAKLIWRRGA